MISLLEKLPDSMMGIVVAGGLWLGFNYLVLADRAMDQVIRSDVLPACEADLQNRQTLTDTALGPLDQMREMPIFGGIVGTLRQQFSVSAIERRRICACAAARSARAARFDYAVHTASLRLIEPASSAELRGEAMQILSSQVCGDLPWFKG